MFKKVLVSALFIAASFSAVTALAGDPVAGKTKADVCVICHGNEKTTGIFFTLQLAGRDADKLAVRTNKYRSGKILMPIMNVFTMRLTDQDVADITAYYQLLGKPAWVSPLFKVKGDDDEAVASITGPGTRAYATY